MKKIKKENNNSFIREALVPTVIIVLVLFVVYIFSQEYIKSATEISNRSLYNRSMYNAPVSINGETEEYTFPVSFKNLDEYKKYTYELTVEAVDLVKNGPNRYLYRKHKALINGKEDNVLEKGEITCSSEGDLNFNFFLPKAKHYTYVVRCTFKDSYGNTMESYVNKPELLSEKKTDIEEIKEKKL